MRGGRGVGAARVLIAGGDGSWTLRTLMVRVVGEIVRLARQPWGALGVETLLAVRGQVEREAECAVAGASMAFIWRMITRAVLCNT